MLTTNFVLAAAVVTTIWLVYYVNLYLPRKLEERFLESMKAFSKAIELRFPVNAAGTDEVIRISILIGKRLGYTRSELHQLELAVNLRDIGCCAIPYQPFSTKSRHEWSDAERLVYSRHPEVSGAMLELVPSLRHVADVVRWHHARYDGTTGFESPVGEALPLNARIIKVAADFVRNSEEVGSAVALNSIVAGKGAEYCPDVVAELEHVLTSTRVKEPEPRIAQPL
jgi:response regulator RpfG family c-di-GMP phosphodiesterase